MPETDYDDLDSEGSDFPEDANAVIDYSHFPNLESIKAFLLDGGPFVTFEARLARFVYPEENFNQEVLGIGNFSLPDPQNRDREAASQEGLDIWKNQADSASWIHRKVDHKKHLKAEDTTPLDPMDFSWSNQDNSTSLSTLTVVPSDPEDKSSLSQSTHLGVTNLSGLRQAGSSERSFSTNDTTITTPDSTTDDVDYLDKLLDDDLELGSSCSDGEERFTNAPTYFQKLAKIESDTFHTSGLAMYDSIYVGYVSEFSLIEALRTPQFTAPAGYQDDIHETLDWAEITQHKVGDYSGLPEPRLLEQQDSRYDELMWLLESRNLLLRTCQNLDRLQGFGYCQDIFSVLVQDSSRENVVNLQELSIKSIRDLAEAAESVVLSVVSALFPRNRTHRPPINNVLGTYTSQFTQRCCDVLCLLGFPHEENMSIWLFTCKVLDVAVLSYAGAHIERFDEKFLGHAQNFHFEMLYDAGAIDIVIRPRRLQCLDKFLGHKTVWVFQQPTNNVNDTRLLLSTDVKTLADIWGPAWRAKDTNHDLVQQYNIGNGFIVPWSHPAVDSENKAEILGSEILSHWISANDWDSEFPKRNHADCHAGFSEKSRLLIGATSGLSPNKTCRPSLENLVQVKCKLEEQHATRPPDVSPPRRYADGVGLGVQASIMGLVSVNSAINYKRQSGTTMKEALIERWRDPMTRSPSDLECNGGLQVSLCTNNALRTTIRDLLRSRTMKNYLDSISFPWISSDFKLAYFAALYTPKTFKEFWQKGGEWRKCAGDAVYLCLKRLQCTGVDTDNRQLEALWIEAFEEVDTDNDSDLGAGEECPSMQMEHLLVKLFRSKFGWTGLVKDSIECLNMTVMVNACLEYKGGRCCRGIATSNRPAKTGDPILQTQLIINQSLMEKTGVFPESKTIGCKGYWKIDSFRRGSKLYLGNHGKLKVLEIFGRCSCHCSALEVFWQPMLSEKVRELKDVAKNEMIMGGPIEMHHWEFMEGVSSHKPLRLLVFPG